MAAAAAAIARRNAQEGEDGKRQRGLRRRSSYVTFLATHEKDSMETLKEKLGTVTRRPSTYEIAQGKALPGLEWMGHEKCVRCCTGLRDNKWFQVYIIGIIFLAGIIVGIQTYPIEPGSKLAVTLGVMDNFILIIFVLEIVVKFIAEGKEPWMFFADYWNVFDFLIVAVGFMPIGGGGSVTVLRLLRLLRVLKLVKALPKLRILVIGLLKSFSSIAYIGVLLVLQFFLFAVLAVSVFGENDPVHLGNLHIAFLTLFRCATFEDWTDVMYIGIYGCQNYGYGGMEDQCPEGPAGQGFGAIAAIYWIVFIMLASMMILNLFIGVITSSMQDAKDELIAEAEAEAEAAREKDQDDIIEARISMIESVLETMKSEMDELSQSERVRGASRVIKLSNRRPSEKSELQTETPINSSSS